MDSLKGTARSNLNDEEWKRNDKGESILEFLTFGTRKLFGDITVDEFFCPERFPDESFLSRRSVEACLCMTRGVGCSKLKTCEAYNEQLLLQQSFPLVKWNNFPILATEEEMARINLIKKGALKLPECCGGLKK